MLSHYKNFKGSIRSLNNSLVIIYIDEEVARNMPIKFCAKSSAQVRIIHMGYCLPGKSL